VLEKFGGIDILVNNAGIAVPGDTADEASEDLWDSIMDINAKGVWLGMKAVLPTMIVNKRGKISAILILGFGRIIQEICCVLGRVPILRFGGLSQ
jgi:NADP-dependent 3-hydroxy acid dehydrogenase YdfG